MPISATFQADFTSFISAVEQAQTKLRDFSSGAATVERSLNRMVDNFSGRKLIEDATKAAEAVDRIGGASNLTQAELQRVTKQAAEAADKMTRLGIDVPPKIAALASQVKETATAFQSLTDLALSAAAGLGVAFSAAAVISGLKSSLEATVSYGNELQLLSQQSGTNVVAFQRLATATSAYGIDADSLARDIFQLSRRIAGDDTAAVAVLGRLGLSFEKLKAISPDQLFVRVAQAVAQVDSPLVKAGDSGALFGARIGAAVQRLPKDFADVVAAVSQTNSVMDEQSVEAAHRFTVSVDQLERSLKSMLGNALSPALEGLAKFIDQSKQILSPTGNAPSPTFTPTLTLDEAKKQLASLGQAPLSIKGNPLDTLNLDFGAQAENLLKSLREQIKPLTDEQQKFLEQLFDMGQLTKENSQAFGVSTAQFDLFKKKEEEIIQVQQTLATQLSELGRLETEVWKNAAKVTDEANKESQKRLDILDRLRVADTLAGNAAIIALNERNNPTPNDPFNQALDRRDDALRQASNVDPKALTSSGQSVMAALQAKAEADFDDALAKIKAGGDKVGNGLVHVADVTHAGASVVGNAFAQIQGVADAAKARFTADQNPTNNVKSFLDNLADQTVSGDFRRTPDLGRTLFNLATAHRAAGGPVTTGSPYMVGENGPELFTPGSNGFISPTPSGGHTFNISVIGATGADHAVLAERIKRQIESTLRGSHRFYRMATLGQAKLNTMRVKAARLDLYQPLGYVTLNGTRCEHQVRKETVRLSKYNSSTADAQGQLNEANFRMSAGSVTPVGLMDLKVYCGSTAPQSLKFGGTLQRIAQVFEGKSTNVAYDVKAVGYGWLFNRRYVNKAYSNQSATAIILDLVATFTTGVTTHHVEAGLPIISINFSNVLPMDALGQIAALCGTAGKSARFSIDDAADLWFVTADHRAPPETITGLNPSDPIAKAYTLTVTTDDSQRRTRVFITGGAQATTAAAIAGGQATAIPVTNALPFDLAAAGLTSAQVAVQTPLSGLPSNGTSVTRTDVLTYTGTSRSGIVQAPTSVTGITVTPANTGGAGHLTNNAAYQWAFSYVTALGETALSPIISAVIGGSGNNAVNITLPTTGALYVATVNGAAGFPPDRSITAINVYRTVANGSQLLFNQAITVASLQWPSSVTDGIADGSLGVAPSLLAFVPQGQTSTTTSSGAGIGDTTILNLDDVSRFDPTGGYATIGDLVVRYTGVTFSNVAGNLKAGTLNLASALTSTISVSATITATPALTGCSGAVAWSPTTVVSQGAFNSGAALTIGAVYGWAVTFVNGSGESLPSALSFPNPHPVAASAVSAANGGTGTGPTNTGVYSYIVGVINSNGVLSALSAASGNITSNGTGITVTATFPVTSLTSQVSVFRTKAGGSTYFLLQTMVNPTFVGGTYTGVDDNVDANLVTAMTTFWTQNYAISPLPIGPAGVTSRKLYRNTGPGTALKLVTTVADNTTTTFTDTVADGSLGATAPTTDTAGVVGLPPIGSGQTLTAFSLKDDTTQQAAIVALIGGDGKFEHAVTDSALLTVGGPDAEATGQLAIYSTEVQEVDVTSRDAKIVPGATLAVNVGSPNNLHGSFLIQSTTTTQLEEKKDGAPYLYPLVEAHGSTVRVVLEDFLWNVKLALDQLQ